MNIRIRYRRVPRWCIIAIGILLVTIWTFVWTGAFAAVIPEIKAAEIETWTSVAMAAGVFIGGLIYAISKLIKTEKKAEDEPLTKAANAEVVRLAKENADLRALQAEDRLRREFDEKLQEMREALAEVLRATQESFHGRLNELFSEVGEIKGLLNSRLPPRQR